MPTTEERVDRLETVFASFMERTEEALADIRASTADVEKVQSIPEFMPEYAGHVLVPVVASVTIEPSVITFLNRQKVYGVAMGDETMELVNAGQF